MKKQLRSGILAFALFAIVAMLSTGVAAERVSQLWSVAVHIQYADGFVYDAVFATGVPTAQLSSILSACGQSHRGGSAVQIHCYPILE